MRNIGALVSACWALRTGARWARVPDGAYGIVLRLDDAERIHGEMVAASPGADQIEVAYTYGLAIGPDELTIHKAKVDKPAVPEPGEWFRVFDIPVIVVAR